MLINKQSNKGSLKIGQISIESEKVKKVEKKKNKRQGWENYSLLKCKFIEMNSDAM